MKNIKIYSFIHTQCMNICQKYRHILIKFNQHKKCFPRISERKTKYLTIVFILSTVLLNSCGGSDAPDSDTPELQVSISYSKVSSRENDQINLSANLLQGTSSGDYSYSWSSNAGGSFDDENKKVVIFTAPSVEKDTSITLTVRVTDNNGNSAIDTEEIIVENYIPPTAVISAVNQLIEGQNTTLSASNSSGDPEISHYQWEVSIGSLNTSNAEIVSYTPPPLTGSTTAVISLTVSNTAGESDTTTSSIRVVTLTPNTPQGVTAKELSVSTTANVQVSWDSVIGSAASGNDSAVQYNIYYSTHTFSNRSSASVITVGNVTSHQFVVTTGTYYVAIEAINHVGIVSPLSELSMVSVLRQVDSPSDAMVLSELCGESTVINADSIASINWLSPLSLSNKSNVQCRFITPEGQGMQNGNSWNDAFGVEALRDLGKSTGTDAVAASSTNVYLYLLKAGVYTPHATNRTISFNLRNHVAVLGGFAGTDNSPPFLRAGTSTLSGDLAGDDNSVGNAENSYQIIKISSLRNSAVLSDVTVAAGNANGAAFPSNLDRGSAIYSVGHFRSHPTLTNLNIINNHTLSKWGGALHSRRSSLTLSNVNITNNSGNGIYNYYSSLILSDSVIKNNNGDGLRSYKSYISLKDVTISNNSTSNVGSGVYNHHEVTAFLDNVSISGHYSKEHGAGLSNSNSTAVLTNVTINGNTSEDSEGGGGIANYGSNVILTNVTISDNIMKNGEANGGGIRNNNSNLTLVNVTISSNTVINEPAYRSYGGGIYSSDSSLTLINTTIYDNQSFYGDGIYVNNDGVKPVNIINSLIWGNGVQQIFVNTNGGSSEQKLRLSYSLLEGGISSIAPNPHDVDLDGVGAIQDTTPAISDLGNNGGVVPTQAIGSTSTAIDNGTYVGFEDTNNNQVLDHGEVICFIEFAQFGSNQIWKYYDSDGVLTECTGTIVQFTSDARGYSHVGRPDIGAFEYNATP